jgi:methionyl-tRNA formyltransferase
MPLRIVFCGTPTFAVPSLRLLLGQPDFQVAGVVTQPDRPRGRGQQTGASAVKAAAVEAGIEVFQPEKIKSDAAYEYFMRVAPDAVVIIAYGQIVPPRLIALPRLGWINLHASLLPKYRGAAPINWAIVNGERTTGLTTMKIDSGLDTGPSLLTWETAIGADETAPELTPRLAEAGAPLVAETLRGLDRGEITPKPQDDSQASLAPPLKKEDGRIDWSLSAPKIYNRIRGLQPWPGAYTTFRGKTCHIWGRPHSRPADEKSPSGSATPVAPGAILLSAALRDDDLLISCGDHTLLQVEFVQLEGRKRVTAREFINGARLAPGDRFE